MLADSPTATKEVVIRDYAKEERASGLVPSAPEGVQQVGVGAGQPRETSQKRQGSAGGILGRMAKNSNGWAATGQTAGTSSA